MFELPLLVIFSSFAPMIWWRTLKNKINSSRILLAFYQATLQHYSLQYKWLPLMHAISISNFPALLKKRERKKDSTPIWSKTPSFSEKPLWLFKFHPVSFKCQKLVLIFKHILFKWSCHQDPPSLSDLQTSERLLCAAFCDLNFDTESNWLHHEKPKVIILMD